jgi:hypothetical protein
MFRRFFILVTSLLLMSKISVGVCQIPPDPFPKPIPPKFDLTIDQKYGQLGGENGFLGKAIGGDKQV